MHLNYARCLSYITIETPTLFGFHKERLLILHLRCDFASSHCSGLPQLTVLAVEFQKRAG
jgi:hypothetical protein